MIGSTRYLALRPEHRSIEIGWTWLTPAAWGTGANVEAKLLMLEHAFERLGCLRVELKTDARNERSRGAMAALPAQFEGVHRKHMLVRGGERRDSAWYSVLDDEWPAVRANLLRPTRSLRAAELHCAARYPATELEPPMIQRAHVIGAGRVGSAIAARLRERGLDLAADEPELVLLCVPDRAIAEVAAATATGPWVAHVSGATPLAALEPHARRFGLHPLQTFTRDRGAEQLDGAFAAITAETEDGAAGRRLAGPPARARAVPARRREARARITQARRSRPTTSSRSDARPAPCSRRPARRPRRSTR